MEIRTIEGIAGPLIIKPRVFYDDRGCFLETYKAPVFKELGITMDFPQDNQSLSQKNVVRGLHFQEPPFAQGKLVRVITGSALDVIVDIRKDSPSYGKHTKVLLTGDNFTQFWIPPGFAHGFRALEDNTIFAYKCTEVYDKASENGLLWNDPELGIDWELNGEKPVVSEKDLVYLSFTEFNSPFVNLQH